MSEFSVQITDEGDIAMNGEINSANVMLAYQAGIKLISTLPAITIDLAKLTRVDSSCLALLTLLMRVAKRQSKAIKFKNMPKYITDLCGVYGLDTVFSVK